MEDNSHLEADPDELLDAGLLHELRRGASLPLATDQELKNRPLLCHGVLIGEDDDQVIFIKKRSPIQLARKSVVATMSNGTLDRLSSPVLCSRSTTVTTRS